MDTSSFSLLIRSLRETVGKCRNTAFQSLDPVSMRYIGDRCEVDKIKKLLSDYKPVPADYSKYVVWRPDRYTRNLIDQGNGMYNMMVMCWGAGHSAPIHSHPGANCFVRMLAGEIREELYTKPTARGESVIFQATRNLVSGDVIHIRDDISIHSMSNVSEEGAVTLHLYTPPYETTEIYREETGEVTTAPIVYTTKGGETQPHTEGVCL